MKTRSDRYASLSLFRPLSFVSQISTTRHALRSHRCADAVVLRWLWVLCMSFAAGALKTHGCLGPQRRDRGARSHERRLGRRAGLLHVLREQAWWRCDTALTDACSVLVPSTVGFLLLCGVLRVVYLRRVESMHPWWSPLFRYKQV